MLGKAGPRGAGRAGHVFVQDCVWSPAIDGPKPYEFIGFGANAGPKPYQFIGFGAIDGPKPYEFIGFGAIDGPKPYEFIGFGAPGGGGVCIPGP